MLQDGSWTREVDPLDPFDIGGESFGRIWFLTDGIYPEITRFVKTISVPISSTEKAYKKWQEGARKDVERSFGVLQSKFRWVTRPIELWDPSEIRNAVLTCIIVHNMMVRYRQSLLDGSTEDYVHYAICESVRNKLRIELRPEEEASEVLEEFGLDVEPASDFVDGAVAVREKTPEERRLEELFIEQVTLKRVTSLRDRSEHFRLRDAIVREVARQRKLWLRNKFKG
jgi:antitoxin component of RelBE/YafQ-DinJ toxin-antitoxin module